MCLGGIVDILDNLELGEMRKTIENVFAMVDPLWQTLKGTAERRIPNLKLE